MPVVYTTAYYSLVVRGRVQRGETVLIHSGSGGVGQAAIAIALSLGCRVFTTVGECRPSRRPSRPQPAHRGPLTACTSPAGSAEKRAYLQARFPQLDDTSFANSRDTSFEQHVLRHTAGKGAWPSDPQLHPLPSPVLPTHPTLRAEREKTARRGRGLASGPWVCSGGVTVGTLSAQVWTWS